MLDSKVPYPCSSETLSQPDWKYSASSVIVLADNERANVLIDKLDAYFELQVLSRNPDETDLAIEREDNESLEFHFRSINRANERCPIVHSDDVDAYLNLLRLVGCSVLSVSSDEHELCNAFLSGKNPSLALKAILRPSRSLRLESDL